MKHPDLFAAPAPARAIIYCDGACSGNPGPGGFGFVLTFADGAVVEGYGYVAHTTNNRMELQAAIEALRRAGSCPVDLHTDSQYLQKGITKWLPGWRRKNWRTTGGQPVKNVDLWQTLDALTRTRDVRYFWVRGHNGDPGNERADALARTAVRTRNTRID